MSSFFVSLFESILTPGPTSTLVLATNISFACLQTVLLALLVATWSIHFVILSILSAGLWWGINWFVAEVRAVKAQQEEEEERKKKKNADAADDTETEGDATGKSSSAADAARQRAGAAKDRADWGSRSEISTEDEWERVDGSEKEKEK